MRIPSRGRSSCRLALCPPRRGSGSRKSKGVGRWIASQSSVSSISASSPLQPNPLRCEADRYPAHPRKSRGTLSTMNTSILRRLPLVCLATLLALSCSDNTDAGGAAGTVPGPTCTNCTPTGAMTFALPSPAGATLWTTTTMDKVLREAAVPDAQGTAISLNAAKNEFEPFQIVVRPDAATTATLSMTPFTGPATINALEVRQVGYVQIPKPSDASSIPSGMIPDPLYPMNFGDAQTLDAGMNQPFWITVFVPPDATAGDYTSTLTIAVGDATQQVAVNCTSSISRCRQTSDSTAIGTPASKRLGAPRASMPYKTLKDFFFQHRLVPSGVAWPAGLNYNGGIEYDCATGTFKQDDNAYDFSQLGPEYIDGTGWNGVGFPSFEVMQFVDNSTPRPQTFCSVDRGPDDYGTDAFNQEWSKLLAAIDAYLVAHQWESKGYYYVQNEPQDQSDYDIAAFLANLTKTAAPHLRIAISEEPKPEIAENAKGTGTPTTCGGPTIRVRPRLCEGATGRRRHGLVVLPLRGHASTFQSNHHRPLWHRVAHSFLGGVEISHQGVCLQLGHRLGLRSDPQP